MGPTPPRAEVEERILHGLDERIGLGLDAIVRLCFPLRHDAGAFSSYVGAVLHSLQERGYLARDYSHPAWGTPGWADRGLGLMARRSAGWIKTPGALERWLDAGVAAEAKEPVSE